MSTILAAPLYDLWVELLGNYFSLITMLLTVQIILSFSLLWIYRQSFLNSIVAVISQRFVNYSVGIKLMILWFLSTFIITPYFSFIMTSLYLYGFILALAIIIVYSFFLCKKSYRILFVGRRSVYFLMHFAIQQIIGYSIYIIVYKVCFWEMYSFPENEEQFWLSEIYPELGVLRRCCDDFIAILCLMAIPYMILGIYSCVIYLVRRLKLLWH